VPSYEAVNWWGLVVPAGMPAPIIERLHKAVQEVQSSAEVQNAAGCDSYISKPYSPRQLLAKVRAFLA
jgi:tripartite-type tricarboxylate transporter receptor subunit TctC